MASKEDPFSPVVTDEEKRIDFVSLCKEFISFYKSFEEDPGLTKYDSKQKCYVTFGISGAGKVR